MMQKTEPLFGHFLPDLPETYKEVLVAAKCEEIPIQAFWNGEEWIGSDVVRCHMTDGFVRDESLSHIQNSIYAWMELPKLPKPPKI